MSERIESNYNKIQTRPLEIGEKDIAHYFESSRFDPRLMEVSTEFIRDFWWNLNPKLLNRSLKNTKYPYAIKPAILAIIKSSEFPNDEIKGKFLAWYEIVLSGIKNPAPQLFYIGLNKIGSKSMGREVEESLPFFTQFNLFSKDLPFNKGNPGIVKSSIQSKVDRVDGLKSECAIKIKDFKESGHLSNFELGKRLGINRVFVSNILNNKLDGITLDYLAHKVDLIPNK